MQLNIFSYKKYIIPIILLSAVLSTSVYSVLALASLFLIYLAIKFFKDKSVIFAVLSGYILLTSDFHEQARGVFNVVAIILFIALFIKNFGFQVKSYPQLPKQMNYLVLVVVFSLSISTLFSIDLMASIAKTIKQLVFFLICYIIYSLNVKLDLKKTILSAIVFSGFILGSSVLIEFITNINSLFTLTEGSVINRFSGIYENPNAVGLFFATVIPVTIYLFSISDNGKLNKNLWIFVIVLLVVVLLLGNSRSSIAAFVLSSGYILFKLKPRIFKFTVVGIIIFTAFLFLFNLSRDYILLYLRFERIFENTRGYFWEIAWSIFEENPLLGSGPGTFDLYIYKYLPVNLGSFTEGQLWWARSGTAHNFYLFRLAETGLVGFITALYFVYVIFNIPHQLIRKVKKKEDKLLLIVYVGIAIGLFGRSFIETTGFLTHGWITRDLPFWLILIVVLTEFRNTLGTTSNKIYNK